MPYIYREYRAGQTVEIYKTFSARYGKNLPRGPNCNPTSDSVRKNNDRLAEMKLRLLLNENFHKGDLFILLTYAEPVDTLQARAELAKFIRTARTRYKAAGLELRYISVTEYLNTRIHHHIVMNSIDPRVLQDIWGNRGQVRSELLYGNDFAGLAAYLIKETKKTFRADNAPSAKRWNQSKNLRQPTEIVRVISAKRWNAEPKSRRGYILIRESVVNDVSPFGIPYQHYRMVATYEKRRN